MDSLFVTQLNCLGFKIRRNISCVPEGLYTLQKRYSSKFKYHLHLKNVVGRSLILIHPANNAKKELEGCIAPVSYHTGIGKGNSSRKAFHKLTSLVLPALAKNTKVQLRITSSLSYFKSQHYHLKILYYEYSRTCKSTYT